MKKEEIVSTIVMIVVCISVMVGFTIAWFTVVEGPTVTGVEMNAKDRDNVKIALSVGGEDISKLSYGTQYANLNMESYTNLKNGMIEPGVSGKVVFYITPNSTKISTCTIEPQLQITQDDTNWYPDEDDLVPTQLTDLYENTNEHICFFSDEAMTTQITVENPYVLSWTKDDNMVEKEAVIYWKWYYEYPFTTDELNTLSDEEKAEKILQYDNEDIEIGNNISKIKFHFEFPIE